MAISAYRIFNPVNILELEILTDDLNNTEEFYSSILGFHPVDKKRNLILYRVGHSTLTFRKSANINPVYHFAFNIPCNQLNDAIKWATPKVNFIKIQGDNFIADFKNWNARAVYFYDNNGNILEFIARFDLDNQSEIPFAGSSIQSVSEVGVVADNVAELTYQLIHDCNLSLFTKSLADENFAAVGDDNGLFIIVKSDRKWFPTADGRAQKYDMRVKISVDGIHKEIKFNEAISGRSFQMKE